MANEIPSRFSLTTSGQRNEGFVKELNSLTLNQLLEPPPELDTPEKRFEKQRELYHILSKGGDITWEEARLGIKSLPSFTDSADHYKGLSIVEMPKSILADAERERIFALAVMNHPDRIQALEQARKEHATFKKPSLGHSQILDQAEVDHILLTFSDVGPLQPDLFTNRLSRHKLLVQGPFFRTSLNPKRGVRLPVSSGSMNTGNPELLAVIAMSGVLATAYREGLCSIPEVQAEVVTEAVRMLHDVAHNDPQWCDRKDRDVLLDFWLNQIGITVGVNSKDAIERIRLLMPLLDDGRLNGLTVRQYNPQVSAESIETVKAIREEFNGANIEILAGQANSVETANELVEAGADAIGEGTMGGSRCTTSIVTGVPVSTFRDLWRMRGKVEAPICVDSSVSYWWALAYLMGASMLVKPSHMIGIESIGGRYPYTDGKEYYVDYSGEASGENKERTGRLMYNGKPFAKEGEGGFGHINLELPSVANQIMDANINFLVPPYVFWGTASGRRFPSISNLHEEADLNFLWGMTAESQKLRGAWGDTYFSR